MRTYVLVIYDDLERSGRIYSYASYLIITLLKGFFCLFVQMDATQNELKRMGTGANYADNAKDYFSNIDQVESLPEETIPECFQKLVKKHSSFPVLIYKSDPTKNFDIHLTMDQYLEQTKKVARGFINLGLEPKASVGIIGFNHPAWFISELGGIFAGGIACGIYTTNNADICKFIMNDCNCQIVVVENDEQLKKVLSILPDVPQLKAIIKYTGDVAPEFKSKCNIPIYTWDELLNLDMSELQVELDKRLKNLKPKDCAVLIYTSGTTGFPKGVMLSHDNCIFTIKMALKHVNLSPFKHSIISYLPLSHIAANLNDIMSSIAVGVTVYFAQPDALKGSLGNTLKEVRPTIFIGVPRVFEKIQEQMQEIGAKSEGLKRSIATWAKSVGYRNNMARISGKSVDLSYHLAKCLVFRKVKQALGLDRCTYLASAAAPLTQQTMDYFISLDMVINQVYGMSECSGPHTMGIINRVKIGSAGSLLKGVELKLADMDENGIGEVCMRGRHVFLGYYNDTEKTKQTLDSDGWLHSGDLGRMEDGEFLHITGRIKELIITAGGENVAPVPIEDRIKEHLPFVSNVMLVGDKQKFLSCLLTIKSNVDPTTQVPTDILSPAAVRSLKDIGIDATTVQQVRESNNAALKTFIDKAIANVNLLSVSKATYVQKWSILPKDFSIQGGEFGPTMKMKRMVIADLYSDTIKSMYS